MRDGRGWRYEPSRHGLAARGVKTGRKSTRKSTSKPKGRMVPVYDMELIAGRGKIGSMNWGYGDPTDAQISEWKSELENEIGEKVILTGGGGSGMHSAILTEVWVDEHSPGGPKGLRVRLANTSPPMMRDGKDFTPWIGSWQISRLKKVGMESEKDPRIEGHLV